jgi:hypothetical protein
MSSTTAGTVWNNLLSANLDSTGAPTIPASPTAFATTGPGAFTGVTSAVTLLTLTIPAGAMSASGFADLDLLTQENSSANNKLLNVTFGGSSWFNANAASQIGRRLSGRVINRKSASIQSLEGQAVGLSTGAIVPTAAFGTVNTASAVNVVVAGTHSTATDNFVVDGLTVAVTY